MIPDRTWDPLRFQRGTRGFAAFLTALNGFAVLGAAVVVAPQAGLPDPLLGWVVMLGAAAGVAHLVAVVGLVRARDRAPDLVTYLAAAGVGVAIFSMLMIGRAGEAVLGASDATALGFFAWMIGSWLIATRSARKAYGRPALGGSTHAVAAAAV